MNIKKHSLLAAAIIGFASLSPSSAQTADPKKVVDALNKVFGQHKARASGAKGQCVAGTFTPTADARKLTKSLAFHKQTPVIGRFSLGGGNPKASDATKALVRGFAFKIDPEGNGTTEFVMVNAPVNFAKSLDQMFGFLEARFPGPEGKPDPDKIKAFAAANPETTRQGQWLAGRPVPASYVGVNYWGIHGYTLTNAEGKTQLVKFKLVPTGGEAGLTDDEAKAKPADFLVSELQDRIAKKAHTSFDFVVILGQPGDPTNDPTVMWNDEEKRPAVKLGTITITKIEKNEACDNGIFDPTILADGVAGPKDDPMFIPRQEGYAISLSRRLKQ
ncbi:MAG: catalase family peroxidase [Xanthobacteraceae bacterium]|nr:catalase family peroxidase [Xanthobacteraceae bacterium]